MELSIQRVPEAQRKPIPPDATQLGFGRYFSDHMFLFDFSPENGWHDPRIVPHQPLALDPGRRCFHAANPAATPTFPPRFRCPTTVRRG